MIKKYLLFLWLTSCLLAAEDPWKADEYYLHSSSQKEAASDLLKHVLLKGDESILDVGCGDGKITAELACKVVKGKVLGVDISSSMILFAKSHFLLPHLEFALKDAQDLDFSAEFDCVFSFTTLQWIQDHAAFLKGAYHSLKPSGRLALTMPLGLPQTLQQAVVESMNSPEWSSYFENFATGWNFVTEPEYSALLEKNQFEKKYCAVVPQKDIFPSREVFERFISQWFPYLRPLPLELRHSFLTEVVDRFLTLEMPFPNGEVHFKIKRLEVVASKL